MTLVLYLHCLLVKILVDSLNAVRPAEAPIGEHSHDVRQEKNKDDLEKETSFK